MALDWLRRLFHRQSEAPLLNRRDRRAAARRRAQAQGGPHWTKRDRHERPRDGATNVGTGEASDSG